MSINMQEEIKARLLPLEELRDNAVISDEEFNALKIELIKEVLHAHQEATKPKEATGEFTPEEIKRQPWLKELLNQRDLWKRHEVAYTQDPIAWEKDVTDSFLAKAAAGMLSPLLTIIGQYLLFAKDKQEGRRYLLELLFNQDPDARLKVHNWYVLETAPTGTAVAKGRKVEKLTVPLFPWTDTRLRELNAKIMDAIDSIEGGSGEDTLRKMFISDEEVLRGSLYHGGGVKPVLDQQGNPTPYFIDTTDIEQACNNLSDAYQKGDKDLSVKITELNAALEKIKKTRSRRRHEVVYHHYGGRRNRGYRGRGYRGGEAEEIDHNEPKNE